LTRARWQSGHAAACKAAYSGSIPLLASNSNAPHKASLLPATAVWTKPLSRLKLAIRDI
jgi:hypothetical protein